MKMRKLMPMMLTVILSVGSIAPEYALAAPAEAEAELSGEEDKEKDPVSGPEAEEEGSVSEEDAEEESAEDADSVSDKEEEAEKAPLSGEETEDEEAAVSVNEADAGSTEIVNEEPAIDYTDAESIRYGTSATPLDGVVYLPTETIAALNEEEREAYTAFCDEAEVLKSEIPEMGEIVIYTDEYGKVSAYYDVPQVAFDALRGAAFDGNILSAPEDVDESVIVDEDQDFFEEPDGAACDPDVPAAVNMDQVEIPEAEDLDISDYEELDMYDELMEEYSELIEAGNLFSSSATTRFYDQLNSSARKWFNKAYENMIKKKKNFYIWTSNSGSIYSTDHLNAISALEDTYPTKLGWKNPAGGVRFYSSYSWRSGYTHKLVLIKSKHYGSGLNNSANKKVKTLVNEAYSYAALYYPQSPTYGIVEYFDKWICENNYYNYTGTAYDSRTRASATYYYCHRQYGILLKGYGVCESYALAMSCLLEKAGVPYIYIVGDTPGGGHAWNYVMMPDGRWYMLDSTWDDAGSYSDHDYFLVPDDSSHTPTGQFFRAGSDFSYPSTSDERYYCSRENFSLPTVALRKGKKTVIKPNGTYENMITTGWHSSNSAVVKVDASGKIKGKKAGSAIVSCRINGIYAESRVVVYELSKLTFDRNGRQKLVDSFVTSSGTNSFVINVGQKGRTVSAEELYYTGCVDAPKVSCSKKNIVSVGWQLSGDQLILRVSAMRAGKTKVKVKFGGKTAVLQLNVKESGIYSCEATEEVF